MASIDIEYLNNIRTTWLKNIKQYNKTFSSYKTIVTTRQFKPEVKDWIQKETLEKDEKTNYSYDRDLKPIENWLEKDLGDFIKTHKKGVSAERCTSLLQNLQMIAEQTSERLQMRYSERAAEHPDEIFVKNLDQFVNKQFVKIEEWKKNNEVSLKEEFENRPVMEEKPAAEYTHQRVLKEPAKKPSKNKKKSGAGDGSELQGAAREEKLEKQRQIALEKGHKHILNKQNTKHTQLEFRTRKMEQAIERSENREAGQEEVPARQNGRRNLKPIEQIREGVDAEIQEADVNEELIRRGSELIKGAHISGGSEEYKDLETYLNRLKKSMQDGERWISRDSTIIADVYNKCRKYLMTKGEEKEFVSGKSGEARYEAVKQLSDQCKEVLLGNKALADMTYPNFADKISHEKQISKIYTDATRMAKEAKEAKSWPNPSRNYKNLIEEMEKVSQRMRMLDAGLHTSEEENFSQVWDVTKVDIKKSVDKAKQAARTYLREKYQVPENADDKTLAETVKNSELFTKPDVLRRKEAALNVLDWDVDFTLSKSANISARASENAGKEKQAERQAPVL